MRLPYPWLSQPLATALSPRTLEAVSTGLSLSPLALLVRTYLFDDWQFLGFLLTLIIVDTVAGVLRSWRERRISSRAFSRVFSKCCIYLGLLVLAHVMTHFTVHGQVNALFQWFDSFIYSAMMARECLSLLEHLASIEPTLVPKALLKRLALFSEDPEAATRSLQAEAAAAPAAPVPLDPSPDSTTNSLPNETT